MSREIKDTIAGLVGLGLVAVFFYYFVESILRG